MVDKKNSFMAFLFGLIVGNKGFPVLLHCFYVTIIVALVVVLLAVV